MSNLGQRQSTYGPREGRIKAGEGGKSDTFIFQGDWDQTIKNSRNQIACAKSNPTLQLDTSGAYVVDTILGT